MRIAVVGGHGQIARLLHPLLVAAGHRPVALVRRAEQRVALEAAGAEVRLLDIENDDVADFARAFDGCDAVVFSAGGGPDGNAARKRTVDLEGSLKSAAAASSAGIRRFVQVSAIDVDRPVAPDADPVWAAYVAAKRDADAALRATALDWTILRPGRLTDAPATGLIALGSDVARGDVTRADVAAVLAAVVDRPESVHRQWNLVGGDVPVADAIARAAAS
ncbi:NAD-dependent epimerase/dehydratase family protein [Nocardioides albidus]|uniref:NAD-dependent epimerase/dehydratase family protein n=1 Tax=Nocardioides albidus TaxID=1517589 RepID=A0A5C4VPK9_9ACTN|nr:NAD(P)H-binding protein [Nocardioides albidus]TNM37435.1 NAD-dependent epimerase/dehydratase family protein [Nocardioides albidus]